MPNRMLRDWTASDKMNGISVHAERFFTRLIMKADDYGCFYANSKLLNSNLFPLKEDVRDADLLRWMAECQNAGLIVVYENSGKRYLQIQDFRQRLDKHKSKFPFPNAENSVVNDSVPEQNRTETEMENEVETEPEQKPNPPRKKNSRVFSEIKSEFLKKAGTEYYFEGKDGAAIKQIEKKIRFVCEQKKGAGAEISDDEVINAWKYILEKMPSEWVKGHYTLPNINSQWNIIIEQLKNLKNGKTSPVIKSRLENAAANTADQFRRVVEGTL